jgi:hypothetical protein
MGAAKLSASILSSSAQTAQEGVFFNVEAINAAGPGLLHPEGYRVFFPSKSSR